jgi:hypothetical protein
MLSFASCVPREETWLQAFQSSLGKGSKTVKRLVGEYVTKKASATESLWAQTKTVNKHFTTLTEWERLALIQAAKQAVEAEAEIVRWQQRKGGSAGGSTAPIEIPAGGESTAEIVRPQSPFPLERTRKSATRQIFRRCPLTNEPKHTKTFLTFSKVSDGHVKVKVVPGRRLKSQILDKAGGGKLLCSCMFEATQIQISHHAGQLPLPLPLLDILHITDASQTEELPPHFIVCITTATRSLHVHVKSGADSRRLVRELTQWVRLEERATARLR